MPVVELAQLAGEGMGLFFQEGVKDDEDVVFVHRLFRGDGGEDVVQEVMNVIGVAFKEVVGQLRGAGEDIPPGFMKLVEDERNILLPDDPVQIELLRAVVKRFCGGVEHVLQDVTIAAGEDEATVVHRLDVGTQECFHVLFRVPVDLLEFVDGEDAGEVGLFQVVEDLPKREFRGVDVAEFDVEGGDSGNWVVSETPCQ